LFNQDSFSRGKCKFFCGVKRIIFDSVSEPRLRVHAWMFELPKSEDGALAERSSPAIQRLPHVTGFANQAVDCFWLVEPKVRP
jgi:hypothetical protein